MSFPIIRKSAQPNKWTFLIPPIRRLIEKYFNLNKYRVDPFRGKNPFHVTMSNDLNPAIEAGSNMYAIDFLINLDNEIADLVFFDPPYSPRQIKECYNSIGLKPTMEDTQGYNQEKKEVLEYLNPEE